MNIGRPHLTRRRIGVIAATGSSVTAMGLMMMMGAGPSGSPTSTPADPGTAHIWVDTNGGSCVDNASPVEYTDAQACTWDGANDTCESGDTVRVKGGDYGQVELTAAGQTSRTGASCEFRPANGETVTVANWFNGFQGNDTGSDRLTFYGPVTARSINNDQTVNVGFDGWTVDNNYSCSTVSCPSEDAQILHMEGVSGAFFNNGEVREACSITGKGGMIYLSGGPMTISNNLIHDAHNCDPGGDPHSECIFATAVNDLTLTRNKFWRCSTMSVFVTGWDGDTYASNWVVENNVIGRPCGDNVNPHVCETPQGNAFHFRTGAGTSGDPAPIPSGWTIRYNTFKGNLSVNGGSPPVANTIKGNIFLSTATCGVGNTTYSYNAHVSGSCGGTGSFNDADLASDFVNGNDYASDGGNWTPISGGAQVDTGDIASYPALDLLGTSRYIGSGPDIGAVEKP